MEEFKRYLLKGTLTKQLIYLSNSLLSKIFMGAMLSLSILHGVEQIPIARIPVGQLVYISYKYLTISGAYILYLFVLTY
jgi:hypothetical protein